jgi:hypothetical protein
MKLSDFSAQRIGEFIAGDPEGWPCRSGPKPDGLQGLNFYRPVERGLEIRIAEKLRGLQELNRKKPQ